MIFNLPVPVFEFATVEIPFFWIFYLVMAVLTFIASFWIIRVYDKEELGGSIGISIMFSVLWPISLLLLLALQTSSLDDRKKEIKKLKKKVK